jgi:hypothetical protein
MTAVDWTGDFAAAGAGGAGGGGVVESWTELDWLDWSDGIETLAEETTMAIQLMFLAIGIAAALATAGMVAIVLVDRAERGR